MLKRACTPLGVVFLCVGLVGPLHAGPLPEGYAWGENIGWIEMVHLGVPRAYATRSFLGGFIWGESVGWIHLGDGSPKDGFHYSNAEIDDYGVNLDGRDLSGFAWGESIGWIEFAPPGVPPVMLRSDGRLEGFAFSESTGWILFLAEEPSLAISVDRGERGYTNPPQGVYSYPLDTRVSIRAIAREGFRFARWEGDVEDPLAASTTVLLDRNKSVRAFFETAGVAIEGRVLTPTGDGVAGADVSLYWAATESVVAETTSDGRAAFSFGEDLSLKAGYYYLTAVLGSRTGRTTEFWASSSPTRKDITIDVAPVARALPWVDDVGDELHGIALLEDELLADMSRHIDDYGNKYNDAQVAFKVANLTWSVFSIVSGVSEPVDSIQGLVAGREMFSSTKKAVGWASTIATITKYGVWDLPRLRAKTPETIEAVGQFLKNHLAGDYGGQEFADCHHCRSADQYHADDVMVLLEGELEEEARLFKSFLGSRILPRDLVIRRLERYMASRERMVKEASDRGRMDSQIMLILPEGCGTPYPHTIPIALRPTYLDYFKTIATLNRLFAGKVVMLGAKITSYGLTASGVVTGPVGVGLGIVVDVGADVATDWIEGLEADARTHLIEVWASAGQSRVLDFESLPNYLSCMRTFLEGEFDRPYYLGTGDFRSTIESVDVEFPKWGPLGLLPDTRRILLTARVRNDGDPAHTVLVVRNYGSEFLSSLFSVMNPLLLPSVLFVDWPTFKVHSLTDLELRWNDGRLASGSTFDADFELLTGVGFLAEILDLQEVVVQAFSGPWETSKKRVFYNLLWESEGKRKKAAEKIPFLRYAKGPVTAGDFEEWRERVGLEAEPVLRQDEPSWTTEYTVPEGVEEVTVSLRETGGSEMVILVTDVGTGSRMGFLAEEGREVRELEGSYTGPHAEKEEVTIRAAGGRTLSVTVTLAVPGLEADSRGSLVVLEKPTRPSVLGFDPGEFEIFVRPGDVAVVAGKVAEVGGQAGLHAVAVEGRPLSRDGGSTLEAEEPGGIEVPYLEPAGDAAFEIRYPTPPDSAGAFDGAVQVASEETGAQDLPVKVYVDGDEPETTLVQGPLREAGGAWLLRWEGSDATCPAETLRYESFLEGMETEWSVALARTEVRYEGLEPGSYAFHVRAVDPAGNTDASPATVAFVVPRQELFVRGDVNEDDKSDIADPIALLSHLFAGEEAPDCRKTADCNDDGKLDIADPIALLNYLFAGADPPPAPFPACGWDPTGDTLGCDSYAHCQ